MNLIIINLKWHNKQISVENLNMDESRGEKVFHSVTIFINVALLAVWLTMSYKF